MQTQKRHPLWAILNMGAMSAVLTRRFGSPSAAVPVKEKRHRTG